MTRQVYRDLVTGKFKVKAARAKVAVTIIVCNNINIMPMSDKMMQMSFINDRQNDVMSAKVVNVR